MWSSGKPHDEVICNPVWDGWDKNETHMQQDLLWFIFKVIPAVQKR